MRCDAMKHYNEIQFNPQKLNGSAGEHTERRVVTHDALYYLRQWALQRQSSDLAAGNPPAVEASSPGQTERLVA